MAMPQFTVTLVYVVEAPNKHFARVRVSEALRFGGSEGVRLDFESTRLSGPVQPASGWLAWLEEARNQLLGTPSQGTQQPAGRKS